MVEYISKEAVLEKAKSSISVPTDNEWDCGYNTAMAEMREFIKKLPSTDVQPIKHGKWIESKKHIWYKKPNGDIDFFAYSEGYCNGVICKKCGEHFCVYCNPLYNEENCERQHYICSECSSTSMEKKKFCPNCGAKMDIIYEDDKIRAIKVTGWNNDARNLTDKETDIYNNRLEAEAETIDEISLL